MTTTASEPDLHDLRNLIIRMRPELATASFRMLAKGWHAIAVDVDDRLIFKFPRGEAAARALAREARLLDALRPVISSMPIPDMRLHEGPPLFSCHMKLKGRHLLKADYAALPEDPRQDLARALARFYAELHRVDMRGMVAAGAGPVEPWQAPHIIRSKALPLLAENSREIANSLLEMFEALPPDPLGMTYGHFDGHGWNMAFDHERQTLNGVYDFADSGIGPVHQEFIYSNFISPDLTERIITGYENSTGRRVDRARVSVLAGVHRLSELAELADDSRHAGLMLENAEEWLAAAAAVRQS